MLAYFQTIMNSLLAKNNYLVNLPYGPMGFLIGSTVSNISIVLCPVLALLYMYLGLKFVNKERKLVIVNGIVFLGLGMLVELLIPFMPSYLSVTVDMYAYFPSYVLCFFLTQLFFSILFLGRAGKSI